MNLNSGVVVAEGPPQQSTDRFTSSFEALMKSYKDCRRYDPFGTIFIKARVSNTNRRWKRLEQETDSLKIFKE